MKKVLISGVILFTACTFGPIFPGPNTDTPQVIWANDFESGSFGFTGLQTACDVSVENDGDYYLLMTAWPSVRDYFGIEVDIGYLSSPEVLPKGVAVSLSFKTLNVESPAFARFKVGGHKDYDLGLSAEWRTVKFKAGPSGVQCWPHSIDLRVAGITNYVSGMALAVDDVVVRPVF